jgi:2-methylisocitrate lyase-like PEP mutase family enzyme
MIHSETARRLGERFAALHRDLAGGFIMPNAWDAGSAILMADAGFSAIGTTSAGIAFSLGRPDYGEHSSLAVTRDAMFARIASIVEAVDVPVNADLEAGYGDTPEAVAATVAEAASYGASGANIEDRNPASAGLYDPGLARERIAAAVSAGIASGRPFLVTARCDSGLIGGTIAEAIERLRSYEAAGAGCLYAPGFSDLAGAKRLIAEIEGPLNFVAGLGAGASPRELLELGARRVSLGGTIARSALALVRRAAEELYDFGTIRFAKDQIPQAELNRIYTEAAGRRTTGAT